MIGVLPRIGILIVHKFEIDPFHWFISNFKLIVSVTRGWVSSSNVLFDNFNFFRKKRIVRENHCFCYLHQNSHSPNDPRNAVDIEFFGCSISTFSAQEKKEILSVRFQSKKIVLLQHSSTIVCQFNCLPSNLDIPEWTKNFEFGVVSFFKLVFRLNSRFDFFLQFLKPRLLTCVGMFY